MPDASIRGDQAILRIQPQREEHLMLQTREMQPQVIAPSPHQSNAPSGSQGPTTATRRGLPNCPESRSVHPYGDWFAAPVVRATSPATLPSPLGVVEAILGYRWPALPEAYARGLLNHCNKLSYNISGSMGLAMWSSMPAARQILRSSLKAFAVIARIGVCA